ncbi:hypothetical protein MKW98_012647 [Papaver atlanticum]|uniref:AAA+ ATPase domain-containing protein n=1 Tax=Papaver atlanticum TaxID=357466 RepID=A0AAD4XP38_9MAGN|nr:hypothetical protein MKW98_012647 [Papaver atlanticum]
MEALMDWKSIGSLYASLMFVRGAVREVIPPEVYKAAKTTFFYFFTNLQTKLVTIHIHEVENDSDNDIFNSVRRYLSSKCFASSKSLRLSKIKNSKNHTYTMVPDQSMVDVFDGVRLTWTLHSDQVEKVSKSESSRSFFKLCFEEKHKEFVDSSYIPHIMKEAEISKFKNRRKKLFTNRSGDCWSQVCQFSHPSTFDTIAMDTVLKQEIKADLKKFVNKSEFYTSVGKAWKRGYLLYGPPGTGKTSLIAAIANYLDFDIYDMELTSVKNNSQLKRLLISTSSKSVIVLEDIDCSLDLSNRKENNSEGCYEEKQKTNGTSSVSLSGILNFVDGLWSPCAGERLIIFTTNHKEKLDPALLRSGRMDKHISLSFCNMKSFRMLAKNYLKVEEHELMKEVEELISSIQMTPADVAECFMSYDEDPDMGMRNVVEEMKRRKETDKKDEEKTDQTKKRLRSGDEENKELKRLRSTGVDRNQDLEKTIPPTEQEEKRKEVYENGEEENDYAY